MPRASRPEHTDYRFEGTWRADGDGHLRLPTTRRDFVIQELHLQPEPSREQFEADARVLQYSAGQLVEIRGRIRAYASPDGSVPPVPELLPGAIDLVFGDQ